MLPNYNYPYMMPSQQPPMVQPRQQQYMMDNSYPVIKGRPVSSFEEARASMIDFDGSVFYFPDLANQKIYTKQINLDGTPSIKIYELAAMPQTSPQPAVLQDDLVTKAEFEQTVNNLLQQIAMLKNASPQATAPVAASQPQPKKEEFQF